MARDVIDYYEYSNPNSTQFASLRLIEQQTYSYCCRPSKMFESQPAVPLPPPQVHVYRTVGNVKIEADVYFPSLDFQKSKCPIFLHIHGGGWMAGHRKEANLLVFYELLQRGFLVVSIDYRLLPEVSIEEQFDDIRAAEDWVRDDLPSKVKGTGWEVASEKVIVGGGSAGAHLAMMVVSIEHLGIAHDWIYSNIFLKATFMEEATPRNTGILRPHGFLNDHSTKRDSPDVEVSSSCYS